MTKRKTTATGLSKTSGQDGKPSASLPVGYANLLTDLKARVRAAQQEEPVRRRVALKVIKLGMDSISSRSRKIFSTEAGTPPGGIILPTLLARFNKEQTAGYRGFEPEHIPLLMHKGASPRSLLPELNLPFAGPLI
jgi:hypothetical protein